MTQEICQTMESDITANVQKEFNKKIIKGFNHFSSNLLIYCNIITKLQLFDKEETQLFNYLLVNAQDRNL